MGDTDIYKPAFVQQSGPWSFQTEQPTDQGLESSLVGQQGKSKSQALATGQQKPCAVSTWTLYISSLEDGEEDKL